MNIEVWRMLGDRPDNVPIGHTIFNAPRPIYGQQRWDGKYRHGTFYSAIDPSDSFEFRNGQTISQRWAAANADLAAWVIVNVDEDTAIEECWQMAADRDVDPNAVGMDWSRTEMTRDMIECWQNDQKPVDIDTDVALAVNSLEALGSVLGFR